MITWCIIIQMFIAFFEFVGFIELMKSFWANRIRRDANGNATNTKNAINPKNQSNGSTEWNLAFPRNRKYYENP